MGEDPAGGAPSGLAAIGGAVTLNLAAPTIYFIHFGRGIGLGGYRIDLDITEDRGMPGSC